MATTSRLTIIAELKDMLTGPLRNVKKSLKDITDATNDYSHHASRQGRLFEKLTKQAGYYVDANNKWRDANNRFVSAAKISALRDRSQDQAWRELTQRYNRAGDAAARMVGRFTRGADGVKAMRTQVNRLGTSLGLSTTHTNLWATRLSSAYARLPAAADAAVSSSMKALDRLSRHNDAVRAKLGSAYKWGALAGGVALGFAMNAGMERINQLQGADVRLDVMGQDEDTRKQMLDMVNEKVTGTFVTLGEGAGILTQQLGAGVDPNEIDQRVQTVIDAAALYAPQDVGRVSMITSQIQAKGRLTGEEALQLGELGAPVYDWVAKDLGIDKSEVAEVIATGKYTSEQFFAAMTPAIEGGAKKMGQTFVGAWLTFKAAVARAAEDFLTPMLEPLEKIFRKATEFFDNAEPFWLSLGAGLGKGIDAVAENLSVLTDALLPWGAALKVAADTLGDIGPELAQGFANFVKFAGMVVLAVTTVISKLLYLGEWALPVVIPVLLTVLHLMAGFGILAGAAVLLYNFGAAIVSTAVGLYKLVTLIPGAFNAVRWLVGELRAVGSLGRFLMLPFIGLGKALLFVGSIIGAWGKKVGAVFARLWGWFSKLSVVARIGGWFAGLWTAIGGGAGILAALRTGLLALFNILRVIPGIGWIITGITAVVAVAMNWGKISDWVREKWTGAIDGIQRRWAEAKAGFARLVEGFVRPFKDIVTEIQWQWALMKAGAERAVADFLQPFRDGWSWVTGLKDTIADFVDNSIAKLQELGDAWKNNPFTKAHDWLQEKGKALGEKLGLRKKEEEPQRPPTSEEYFSGKLAPGAANVNMSMRPTDGGSLPGSPHDPANPRAAKGTHDTAYDGKIAQLNELGASTEQVTRLMELGVPMGTQMEWAAKGIYQPAFAAAMKKGEQLTEDEVFALLSATRGGAQQITRDAGTGGFFTRGPQEGPGFFTGGYTGDYGTHEVAGYVHGQEFVLNAAATRNLENTAPGAAEYINAHGQLPPAPAGPSMTFSPQVSITVGSEAQGAEVAAAVRAEIDRQMRQMKRAYMTPTARGAN